MLLVDGGDFVPPAGDSLRTDLAAFMIEGMARMAYHAVGPGELELELGPAYLHEAAGRLPLVSANLTENGAPVPGIPRVRTLDLGGYRVAVTGYIDPLLFYEWPGAFQQQELAVEDPVESLAAALAGVEADVTVLLAHAERASIEDVLERVPGVDVTVQGHKPTGSKGVGRLGDSLFLVPGYRSRDVRLATVRFGENGIPYSAGYRIYRLQAFGNFDPELERMVAAFQEQHGLK